MTFDISGALYAAAWAFGVTGFALVCLAIAFASDGRPRSATVTASAGAALCILAAFVGGGVSP